MAHSFTDLLALATLLLWPAIPLFWIPVHLAPGFFRRLGFFTYVLPLVTWLPLAFATFAEREILLQYKIEFNIAVKIAGAILFILGAGLQLWTLFLLTTPVIIGMPEVTQTVPGKLMTRGPFAVMRHPTYLSHTMMLLGLFLFTAVTAIGAVTILDAAAVNAVVIPLEEKELLQRFGKEYEDYRRRVRSRFLPKRQSKI